MELLVFFIVVPGHVGWPGTALKNRLFNGYSFLLFSQQEFALAFLFLGQIATSRHMPQFNGDIHGFIGDITGFTAFRAGISIRKFDLKGLMFGLPRLDTGIPEHSGFPVRAIDHFVAFTIAG